MSLNDNFGPEFKIWEPRRLEEKNKMYILFSSILKNTGSIFLTY